MNTNTLQTIKARKIAKACEGITAEEFLRKFDHLLLVALRMAESVSRADISNPECESGIRGAAMEDVETWQVFAETIERLTTEAPEPVADTVCERTGYNYTKGAANIAKSIASGWLPCEALAVPGYSFAVRAQDAQQFKVSADGEAWFKLADGTWHNCHVLRPDSAAQAQHYGALLYAQRWVADAGEIKANRLEPSEDYHTVVARDNARGAWFVECGFECIEDAKDERAYAADTYGARNVKIITTANNKDAIERAISALNN